MAELAIKSVRQYLQKILHTPHTKMNTWESNIKTYERHHENFQLKSVQRNAAQIWQSQDSLNIKCSDVSHTKFSSNLAIPRLAQHNML
jgi:hypothetical protein